MRLFPLLLPGGLLRRGLGGRREIQMWKDLKESGILALAPALLSLCMFDHRGEEAVGEKVQAQGGGSWRQISNGRGTEDIRETWLRYPEALSDEREGPCLVSVPAAC